jgi:subtilisin family serine protease
MKTRFPIVILLLAAVSAWAADTDTFNGHTVVAQQVILRLNTANIPGPISGAVQQLSALANVDDFRPLDSAASIYVVHSRSIDVAGLLRLLTNLSSVAFVEPDYIVSTKVTPNDVDFSQEWGMLNTTTPGADIGATLAWGISTGSTANVIGVVDTGIDYTHPDLAANVWSAPSAFTVTLSFGQLTCPAGSHGYNAIARSCNPADDNSHGTHVSGTIGAIGNNGIGVAGVNWTTQIMSLKFLDSTGSGSISNAIDAIDFGLQAKTIFGAGANLRVLSNSWGGTGFTQSLLNEINKANTANVLFVAAAGNSTQNNDVTAFYPADYVAPNVISVAATTITDGIASFSNYGPTTVHLGAPGLNILSTVPNGGYAYLSGTSMATPHVSGAAMLVLSACSLNTASLKSTLLANVDPISSLTNLTVTGGRLNVNKAIRSCAASKGTGTASFVKTDTATAGTWKGVYGADGYDVIADSASIPAYAAVTPSGNASFTWAASTPDPRGMQKGASLTDRVAACWVSGTSFTVDLTFNDSNSHQVALYMLDWDTYQGGRTQRVEILDPNSNILDTRLVSSFTGGQYLVWNLSGHVIVRVTNTNPLSNAVVSGLLFGGPGSVTATGTASYLRTDTTTAGSWRGAYGAEGYNVIGDSASIPTNVAVNPAGNSLFTWALSSTDARAMERGASSSNRIAACWFSGVSFTIDLAYNDAISHQFAMYMLDWDTYQGGRTQRVDILDGNNNILDTRLVSAFTGGQYLVWNLSGHVIVRVTNTNPLANAVVSGLLFGGPGPVAASAAYVKADTTTAGSWQGVYGVEGYNVIDDTASIPAYVAVTPSGNSTYLWAASTVDSRAMEKGSNPADRIAACWFSGSSFTVDLNFTDSNSHQLALYMLDWDTYQGGRTQRVDILDSSSNVLDTRLVSNFSGGEYLVWNLTGHVVVRITNTNAAANAVLSGILFK